MKYRKENLDEFDDYPDEYLDERQLEDKLNEMDTPEVEWSDYIEQIEDLESREKEIQTAARIADQLNNLDERYDSGEITEDQYLLEYDLNIKHNKKRAAASSALESGNFTSDHLGDIADQLHTIDPGSVEMAVTRDLVERTVDTLGAESVQNMADKMLGERKISKDAYKALSQDVRFYKK